MKNFGFSLFCVIYLVLTAHAAQTTNTAPQTYPTAISGSGQSAASPLMYDDSLSFEINLQKLKTYCQSHPNDECLDAVPRGFLQNLFEHSKGEFAVVKGNLRVLGGGRVYRNVLLAALTVASATISDKADLAWQTATNRDEPVEIRRLGARLISQFADGKARPAELSSLLNDPDSDIVILALRVPPRQMEKSHYDRIKTSLLNSSDINIRVAAVDAIGNSTNVEKETDLLSLISEQHTSQKTIFSDASLLKRKAISHLQPSNPQSHELISHIVLDTNEDAAVRSRAISKFTPEQYPESTQILLHLLDTANSNEAILLAAIEDNLLSSPSPAVVKAIRGKADRLSDPQLREFMIKRLEKITTGGPQ